MDALTFSAHGPRSADNRDCLKEVSPNSCSKRKVFGGLRFGHPETETVLPSVGFLSSNGQGTSHTRRKMSPPRIVSQIYRSRMCCVPPPTLFPPRISPPPIPSDRREGRGAKSVFLPFCVPHPLNTPPPPSRNQFKAPYRQIGFLFALEREAPSPLFTSYTMLQGTAAWLLEEVNTLRRRAN